MKKVTVKDIRKRVGYINQILQDLKSDSRIHFEHRYDYYALDEVDADGTPRRTIKSNLTKRQAFDALYFMEEALYMTYVLGYRIHNIELID